MATQQDVIKKFMKSLDTTTKSGTNALDEAVNSASDGKFKTMASLINSFKTDMSLSGGGDAFLKNYCGINLSNADTGSITGSDAGGNTTKTAESIVEEFGSVIYPTGTSATIGGLIQGLSFRKLMVVLARTVVGLRKTVVTIISLIALASIMNYSGMIAAIAAGLVAVTGPLYPLFAPLIGAIGTFVTGSDTSSNILFAKLQANVAGQLGMTGQGSFFGVEGSQTNWLVAANTTGATGGKMISPQSIAIATAACDMQGKDGEILRSALPYALLYIVLGGLMVFFGV